MKPIRACPVCPKCGSKKFQRLEGNDVRVQCLVCRKTITI